MEQVRAAWRPTQAYLLDRHGTVLHELRIDLSARRLAWTALADISPSLVRAVIQAEDRRFYGHRGVDWRAVAGAAWDRLTSARSRRGASTVSMQLTALLGRNASGKPGRRDVWDKWTQMHAALELEQSWRKDEILEAYLNLAGFRGELQGIAAGARGLFGKAPSGLDDGESLLLAALLPAPNAAAPVVARRACILAAAAGVAIACRDLEALAQRLSGTPRLDAAATLAPHLAAQLLHEPGEAVSTTLETPLQRIVADTLAQQLRGLAERNVRDGSAVVVDNASGDILAYVGSAGPYSRSPQVDGARAGRQAGSTLKPFLYALALDRGYLTAASLLHDSPVSLETPNGLYIPQNYDRDFKGMISVRTALASSLNVPAVRTLALVGVEPFRDYLNALGYARISRDGGYYGYSLALGSAEVSLLEQVAAYRALANGGRSGGLRLKGDAVSAPLRQLIAEPAAFIVADILADRTGRALTFGLDSPLSTRYWTAVKTGTSKDMRDNWCIGFSRRYTVGVWVGNFEGDAMHDVSGITGAAPVWQAIMDALQADAPSESTAPRAPDGVVTTGIEFRPALEPPRREWFLAGTEVREVVLNAADTRRPHIVSPPQGLVIALDPDIPPSHQAVIVKVSSPPIGAVVALDGQPIGAATEYPKWTPLPGPHRLTLVAATGTVIDTVDFSVRRLPPSVGEPAGAHREPADHGESRH